MFNVRAVIGWDAHAPTAHGVAGHRGERGLSQHAVINLEFDLQSSLR